MKTKRVEVAIYRECIILERAYMRVEVPVDATREQVIEAAEKWYENPDYDPEWKELECCDVEWRQDLTADDDIRVIEEAEQAAEKAFHDADKAFSESIEAR